MAIRPCSRLLRNTLGTLALFLLSACSECPRSLVVPLTFRPEMVAPGKSVAATPSPGLRLSVAPISDERAQKERIGQNIEIAGDPRPVFATGRAPAEFMQEIVAQELSSAGYPPVAAGATVNRVLMVMLDEFFTTESHWYNCVIRITSEVRDANGTVLWHGRSTGTSKRFGRSLAGENYQECFSDAALLAVGDLIANKEFQAAMLVP